MKKRELKKTVKVWMKRNGLKRKWTFKTEGTNLCLHLAVINKQKEWFEIKARPFMTQTSEGMYKDIRIDIDKMIHQSKDTWSLRKHEVRFLRVLQ